MRKATEYTDIVFDGPPAHESGRFVEVEDASGASIEFGEWVERADGYWALRVKSLAAAWEEGRKVGNQPLHFQQSNPYEGA